MSNGTSKESAAEQCAYFENMARLQIDGVLRANVNDAQLWHSTLEHICMAIIHPMLVWTWPTHTSEVLTVKTSILRLLDRGCLVEALWMVDWKRPMSIRRKAANANCQHQSALRKIELHRCEVLDRNLRILLCCLYSRWSVNVDWQPAVNYSDKDIGLLNSDYSAIFANAKKDTSRYLSLKSRTTTLYSNALVKFRPRITNYVTT